MPASAYATGQQMSHFCATLIWAYDPDTDKIMFLVLEYQERGHSPQLKFPGGTNNGHPNEKRDRTRDRELKEETGFTCPVTELIYQCEGEPDLRREDDPNHMKYFYLAMGGEGMSYIEGELREVPLVEQTGEKLGIPTMMEACELQHKLHTTHVEALYRAARRLAGLDSRYAHTLQPLL